MKVHINFSYNRKPLGVCFSLKIKYYNQNLKVLANAYFILVSHRIFKVKYKFVSHFPDVIKNILFY